MSSSKRAFGGLFWTISANMLNAFFGFFSTPILIHHFGKGQYALIGLAFSVNVYLRLMDMNYSMGNIKYFSQWIAQKKLVKVNKLFQTSLSFYAIVGLINALVLGIVAIFAKDIWNLKGSELEIVHDLLYILMASAFLGWISSLMDQFLRANEIIGWEQRLMIFVKIIQIIVLYFTVTRNYSVVTYVMLSSFSALLILPFAIRRIKQLKLKISFVPRFYTSIFRRILPYSLSVFSFGIFQYSANYLRPVLLSLRAGVLPVADYRILDAFGGTISFLSGSFIAVLLPMATKAVTLGNIEIKNKIAHEGTKYLTIFISVVIFGFVLVSRDILTIYARNNDYLVIWLNIWVLTLLLSHNSAISSLVFAENRLRPILYISIFSTITSLTLEWYITPHYRVGGVTLGYLYYSISQLSFSYIYYYPKILKLDVKKIFVWSFLLPASALAVCAVISHFIVINFVIKSSYMRVFIGGGTFLLIALPVIYFLILNSRDKAFIKRLITKEKPLPAA
jgi:O-antigen/teichoic acid export membrane protein